MALLLSLGLLAMTVSGSVTVRKTGTAPTGYEVDFKYVDKTASNVSVKGDTLGFYTDQFHTTLQKRARKPPSEYKAGDFFMSSFALSDGVEWPYDMEVDDDGVWTLTTPLPSGTYVFHYQVACDTCDVPKTVVDPEVPPFENVPGDQVVSSFHVPLDPDFQLGDLGGMLVNNDYALEAPDGKRGTVQTVNYTSPGSIWPAPDVHDFSIYLPVDYDQKRDKKYPLLYLVHGVEGNGADWENKARASHILDNLIAGGHIEPTVVVMPSFYNLDDSLPLSTTSTGFSAPPSLEVIRQNFHDILFPYIEDNYNVCDESWCRAIAGLSMGGMLTYEMWVNATDFFDYFGFFSSPGGFPSVAPAEATNMAKKGLFVGFGLYDNLAFDSSLDFQRTLDLMNVEYVSRITPFGEHLWPSWQDSLWWFADKTLWKPIANHSPS